MPDTTRDSVEALRAFNRPASIATIVAIIVLGPAVFLILPAFVGALAETYGFTEAELGWLASADLAGMALAAPTALYWRTRWNWRWVAALSTLWIVSGNIATIAATGFGSLLAVRLTVGFGSGMLVAIGVAFIGYTKDPDRVAAIFVFCQVVFISTSFALTPTIMERWGITGIFVGLAALTGLLLALVPFVPVGPPEDGARASITGASFRRYVPGLVVLVSMTLFFIGQASVWAFIGLIGEGAGLSSGRVAAALSISTLISLSGPVSAMVMGDRFGRRRPLAVAVSLQLAALVLLSVSEFGFSMFLVLIATFQSSWNVAVGYQFGVLVQADATSRLMVLIPTFQAGGIALGPALAGMVVGAFGFGAVPVVSGVALVLYAATILPHAEWGSDVPSDIPSRPATG